MGLQFVHGGPKTPLHGWVHQGGVYGEFFFCNDTFVSHDRPHQRALRTSLSCKFWTCTTGSKKRAGDCFEVWSKESGHGLESAK